MSLGEKQTYFVDDNMYHNNNNNFTYFKNTFLNQSANLTFHQNVIQFSLTTLIQIYKC